MAIFKKKIELLQTVFEILAESVEQMSEDRLKLLRIFNNNWDMISL
jgi:hypothetical protein